MTEVSTCFNPFLNPNNLASRLNGNLASSLMVDLVKKADPSASLKVRDIKSLSRSLTWLSGASFQTLMSSCHGASTRSFIHTYFNCRIQGDTRLKALIASPTGYQGETPQTVLRPSNVTFLVKLIYIHVPGGEVYMFPPRINPYGGLPLSWGFIRLFGQ